MKEQKSNQQTHHLLKEQNNDPQKEQIDKYGSKQYIEDAPFTLTFGKGEKLFFNPLFDTSNTKIHSKKITPVKRTYPEQSLYNPSTQNHPHSSFKIRQCITNDQLHQIKQKLSKITYSIKTIESKHSDQIGISSKRVIMGTQDFQTQKLKLTQQKSQRNRCQSSLGFRMVSEFQYQNDENLETARFKQPQQTVNKNKFSSKRLNVLIRRKSLAVKHKQKQTYPKQHFMFFQPESSIIPKNESNKQNDQNNLGCNKISIRKQKTLKQKLENKKLKYEQYLMKKQTKVLGQRAQNGQQTGFKLALPQDNEKNQEKKRKLSLSKFISKYNTQNMQNYEGLLLQKGTISKPLKQIFKNKFSTISKISQQDNPINIQKVVFKMRKRKNSILSKNSNKQNQQIDKNSHKSIQNLALKNQFKRYNQIQKENFYL